MSEKEEIMRKDKIRILRNSIWSYEARANPTPKETREYRKHKRELHQLLSLEEILGTEIEENN